MPSDTILALVQRKTAGQTQATDGLIEYLRSLDSRGLASAEIASSAEQLWSLLRDAMPGISQPAASPFEGGVRFAWTSPGRYLEIEINADSGLEWFYRDTPAQLSDFGQSTVADWMTAGLLKRLRAML
jgi:hypothetical protein